MHKLLEFFILSGTSEGASSFLATHQHIRGHVMPQERHLIRHCNNQQISRTTNQWKL